MFVTKELEFGIFMLEDLTQIAGKNYYGKFRADTRYIFVRLGSTWPIVT